MTNIKENQSSWQSGKAKNITFIVTKDCQLAYKYCCLVGKNEKGCLGRRQDPYSCGGN